MPSRLLHQGAALLHLRKGVQQLGRDLRLRGAQVTRPLQVSAAGPGNGRHIRRGIACFAPGCNR